MLNSSSGQWPTSRLTLWIRFAQSTFITAKGRRRETFPQPTSRMDEVCFSIQQPPVAELDSDIDLWTELEPDSTRQLRY